MIDSWKKTKTKSDVLKTEGHNQNDSVCVCRCVRVCVCVIVIERKICVQLAETPLCRPLLPTLEGEAPFWCDHVEPQSQARQEVNIPEYQHELQCLFLLQGDLEQKNAFKMTNHNKYVKKIK